MPSDRQKLTEETEKAIKEYEAEVALGKSKFMDWPWELISPAHPALSLTL